ncbi:alpha/beta hydrolase [Deinococcus irradiatisoli]|uniref:Alpha/beta hydrolase n=2 Tax=Deinococcus irradiatisoli TaxID=2202254 RepID=A0A2Z3JBB6_9DEIO|nr:alpha/beta hydrolase [Deinococcus irradiatisoli]
MLCSLLLSSCAPVITTVTQPSRPQNTRVFTAAVPTTPSIAGATLYKGLYPGEHGQASYLIEVPDNWNGKLVMYAHGYAGMGAALTVSPPALREYLVAQGYAWAASSYSSNYYDVRSGIEDTNALAEQFGPLTGGKYPAPSKTYIMGVSMGGNVAAAAVEAETLATARHKVKYAASMPLCGVLDPPYEFQWLGDYTLNAQQLSGYGAQSYPASDFQTLLPDIKAGLFSDTSGALWTPNTVQGARLRDISLNLTGGPRPVFDLGFRVGGLQDAVLSTGGSDGTLNGILVKNIYGNKDVVYRWTSGPTPTPAEIAYNKNVVRTAADPQANPQRADGLRWLPAIHGQFNVPVLTMHTLGDFYVPFAHEQHYLKMAQQNGNAGLLVQRAIRAAGHCEFTAPEFVEAFNDWMKWEQTGQKPAGDDVLTPSVVADAKYGCKFTRTARPGVEACEAPSAP